MTALKSLPARPSLESLRKQAKKLAREIASENADAIGRARAQLENPDSPLSQRDAQLVIAREYGFTGWRQLLAEVQKRLDDGLAWAKSQARRIIHDNDVEGLKQLLVEYPALLSDGELLHLATTSFGDSGDPEREQQFTRPACAEVLLDVGAVVLPSVCDALVVARTRGLLALFERKGVLPRTLKFRVAVRDLDGVRANLDSDFASLNEAFLHACHLDYEDIAALLLDRLVALDAELGKRIDGGPGRSALIQYLMKEQALHFIDAHPATPWQRYLMERVVRSIHEGDLARFVGELKREAWLLGESCVGLQVGLIERSTLRDRGDFIRALLDLDPALLRRRPPPESQAIEFAICYAKPHLMPLLTRVWEVPDDLPHAAGMGDLDRVKKWFDASGKPALGDLVNHSPCNNAYTRGNLQWGEPSKQQALDAALAYSVINHHFDVAEFLLAHGADISTRWGSHEPASILHELVGRADYEGMQFLIDHGIDMTIKDYRWGGTAADWAYYAMKDEKMTQWLTEAETRRKEPR